MEQGLDDCARALRRKAPVGGEGQHQEVCTCRSERPVQVVFVFACGIKVVERLGHDEVGVRVEVGRELVPLVAQVGLDLELDVVAITIFSGAQPAPKLVRHRVIRQVRDVAQHARKA